MPKKFTEFSIGTLHYIPNYGVFRIAYGGCKSCAFHYTGAYSTKCLNAKRCILPMRRCFTGLKSKRGSDYG